MQPSDLPRERLPRDAAGKMAFPPENGAIKKMVDFDDYMEIYAVRATCRVRTPDHLDPARTVPSMPWSSSTNASVGASNPIVARVEPVSLLTIYTSAEPSRICSPPASPVRPKATGRVQLLLE